MCERHLSSTRWASRALTSMRVRAVLVRITAVSIVIMVSFLALEAAYRLYKLKQYGMVDYPDLLSVGYFELHPLYGMVPKKNFKSDDIEPKLRQSGIGSFQARVTFNRWGYRGKDFSIEKEKGALRIVTFGGSTTMSLEVDDPDTWPAQLEAKLQEDGNFLARHGVARVEVINAGVGGWRTREGLLRLREEVRGLAPDMILVAFNWNDAIAGLDGEDPDRAISAEPPWWSHSTLLQNLRIRYLVHKSSNEALYKSWIAGLRRDEPWAKTFEQNLLAMRAIARDLKAEMVLVNLPGLCRKESRDSSEYEMIVRKTRVTLASFDFYVSLKAFISSFLYDIARDHDMTVSDVSSYFENFSDAQRLALFTDEMHANTAGSGEIATAVYLCLAREACQATLLDSPKSVGYQGAIS